MVLRKPLPVDLVATWQPERESLLPTVKDLAAIAAAAAFCGFLGAVCAAILIA